MQEAASRPCVPDEILGKCRQGFTIAQTKMWHGCTGDRSARNGWRKSWCPKARWVLSTRSCQKIFQEKLAEGPHLSRHISSRQKESMSMPFSKDDLKLDCAKEADRIGEN